MRFSDTYAFEVQQSRRIRAQRAGFWARIVAVLLMLTIGAVLRANPDLRKAIFDTGVDAILAVSGQRPGDAGASGIAGSSISGATGTAAGTPRLSYSTVYTEEEIAPEPARPTLPRDRVKVNRFGQEAAGMQRSLAPPSGNIALYPQTSREQQTSQTQALAQDLGRMLERMQPAD